MKSGKQDILNLHHIYLFRIISHFHIGEHRCYLILYVMKRCIISGLVLWLVDQLPSREAALPQEDYSSSPELRYVEVSGQACLLAFGSGPVTREATVPSHLVRIASHGVEVSIQTSILLSIWICPVINQEVPPPPPPNIL